MLQRHRSELAHHTTTTLSGRTKPRQLEVFNYELLAYRTLVNQAAVGEQMTQRWPGLFCQF
jgi:hypothetical protein